MNDKHSFQVGNPISNSSGQYGLVYVHCFGLVSHPVAVIVKTMTKVVYEAAHCLPSQGGTILLNLSDLRPGEYQVTFACGYQSRLRKLTLLQGRKQKPTWLNRLLSWRKDSASSEAIMFNES